MSERASHARRRFVALAAEGALPTHEFFENVVGTPMCQWCTMPGRPGDPCPSRILDSLRGEPETATA